MVEAQQSGSGWKGFHGAGSTSSWLGSSGEKRSSNSRPSRPSVDLRPGTALALGELLQHSYVENSKLKRLRVVGHGAFAQVEKAELTMDNTLRIVAVKQLLPGILDDQKELNNFIQEAKSLSQLHHRNVIEFIGVGCKDRTSMETIAETLYIVQEYLQGGTLKKAVMDQMTMNPKPLYSLSDALRWMLGVAEGLAYLHSCKPMVIHRDLKLENILLKGKDIHTAEAVIADFGLMRYIEHQEAKRKEASAHGGSVYGAGGAAAAAAAAGVGRSDGLLEMKDWDPSMKTTVIEPSTHPQRLVVSPPAKIAFSDEGAERLVDPPSLHFVDLMRQSTLTGPDHTTPVSVVNSGPVGESREEQPLQATRIAFLDDGVWRQPDTTRHTTPSGLDHTANLSRVNSSSSCSSRGRPASGAREHHSRRGMPFSPTRVGAPIAEDREIQAYHASASRPAHMPLSHVGHPIAEGREARTYHAAASRPAPMPPSRVGHPIAEGREEDSAHWIPVTGPRRITPVWRLGSGRRAGPLGEGKEGDAILEVSGHGGQQSTVGGSTVDQDRSVMSTLRKTLTFHSPALRNSSLGQMAMVANVARKMKEKQASKNAVTSMTGVTGSLMYMAPEVYNEKPYNQAVDVFSFAIVMFEVFNRDVQETKLALSPNEEQEQLQLEAYAEKVAGGFRPDFTAHLPAALVSLIRDCWSQIPANRPSMRNVVERLKMIKDSKLLEELDAAKAKSGAASCGCF